MKIKKNPLLPPLRPEDFKGEKALVCRVKAVSVDVPSKDTRTGKATFMELHEFPGKGLYLNATSQDNAVAGFQSDETNEWIDKQVPVIEVQAAFEDRVTHVTTSKPGLWVAPPEQWKKLLRDAPKAKGPKVTTV